MDSNGRVALVTGASRGIGKALAIGLARNGYDVAVADLPVETSALNEARREVESLGRRAYSFELDVRRKNEADQTVAKLLQRAGQIDVLVNNAGILKTSLLQDLGEDAWNAHFDVNAKGVLFMCQAVLPHMRQRKTGQIINIASIAGRQGVATQGHYAATKAAVITLTRVLAQEVGMDGVTVNAICPGIIMTEMGRNNLRTAEARLYWENATSLRRLGQPEDIVGPVCFFASADSDFVTGQSLNVCGGLYFH